MACALPLAAWRTLFAECQQGETLNDGDLLQTAWSRLGITHFDANPSVNFNNSSFYYLYTDALKLGTRADVLTVVRNLLAKRR